MSADVNSRLVQRGIKNIFRIIHLIFGNFEWASIAVLFFLPKHAFISADSSSLLYQVLGSWVLLVGIALRIWARGYEKNGRFVLDGPYRYVQNPDELASLIMFAGAYLVLGVIWSWVFVLVALILFYFGLVSSSYEESLKKKAGQNYPRYRQRVKRWIPSVYPLMNRTGAQFLWKKALRNEYVVWLWLLGLILYKIIVVR